MIQKHNVQFRGIADSRLRFNILGTQIARLVFQIMHKNRGQSLNREYGVIQYKEGLQDSQDIS
jgi:hypothetical protein